MLVNSPPLLLPLPRVQLVSMPVNVRVRSFPATIRETSSRPKSTPVPVIYVDIDRSKANELGISMRSIGDTLALLVGEHYVNRFNRVGRSYEVIQQVPLTPETLTRYYVNSAAGQPVPLSNLVTLKTATEPNAV